MGLRLAYVLAWAVATALVAGASWLGIRTVLAPQSPTRPVAAAAPGRGVQGPAPTATPAAPRASGRSTAAPASPSPAASWTAVANGQGGTAYRRTFRTVGGEVAVWCEPGSARVLATTPKPGYTVDIARLASDAVQVSFVKDRLASRVLVRWWDAPYAELTETSP